MKYRTLAALLLIIPAIGFARLYPPVGQVQTSSAPFITSQGSSASAWQYCPTNYLCTASSSNGACLHMVFDCPQGQIPSCPMACGNSACPGSCCKCLATGTGSSMSSKSSSYPSSTSRSSSSSSSVCTNTYVPVDLSVILDTSSYNAAYTTVTLTLKVKNGGINPVSSRIILSDMGFKLSSVSGDFGTLTPLVLSNQLVFTTPSIPAKTVKTITVVLQNTSNMCNGGVSYDFFASIQPYIMQNAAIPVDILPANNVSNIISLGC